MNIRIVRETVTVNELKDLAKEIYRSMIKGAIDVEKGVVAFGGEYHVDAANKLVELGSKMDDVWGFNVRFDVSRDSCIEYTALINIKPGKGNRAMLIADKTIRDTIKRLVESKIV